MWRRRIVLLAVCLVSAAYVYPIRLNGWIPHDEGVLAMEAKYVHDGGLPHRDFPEIYTGGLSYWNALAYRVFGVRISSLRLAFFLAFLAFVPAVFAIASRFGKPVPAALVTLLAVVWSVPNYLCGSAAWYNLFFGVWALLALFRYVETGRRRWLFAAGVLAGASFLFKVSGVYVVAVALLLLLYREQQLSGPRPTPSREWRFSGFLLFKAAGLTVFVLALFLLVLPRLEESELFYLLLPAAILGGFLIWCEATEGGGSFERRFSALMGPMLVVAAGFLAPILLFLLYYASRGGLQELRQGMVTGTGAHLNRGAFLPPFSRAWPALPYAAVLGAGSLRRIRPAWSIPAVAAAAGAAAWGLWRSADSMPVYRWAWDSAFFLGAFVVPAAVLQLSEAHRLSSWSIERRQEIFLLAAAVAMFSMVLFPLGAAFYFFYFASVVALAVFALAASARRPPWILHLLAWAFFFLFAVLRTNPSSIFVTGHHFEKFEYPVTLSAPRAGGLRVTEKDGRIYNVLIPIVRERSRDRPIYAGPDAPEVYFLSGLPDVARHDAAAPRDPLREPDDLFAAFEREGTRVAVLNRTPPFRKIRPAVLARFESVFPESREIGPFTVRWRN